MENYSLYTRRRPGNGRMLSLPQLRMESQRAPHAPGPPHPLLLAHAHLPGGRHRRLLRPPRGPHLGLKHEPHFRHPAVRSREDGSVNEGA